MMLKNARLFTVLLAAAVLISGCSRNLAEPSSSNMAEPARSELEQLEDSLPEQESRGEELTEPPLSSMESPSEINVISKSEPKEDSPVTPEKESIPTATEEEPRAGLGRKLTLTVQSDEPADVAGAAMETLLFDLTAPDLPDNTRILSYEITDVQILAGDISEFAAAIEFTVAVEPDLAKSHGLVNINLPDAQGDFACGWQLRIKETATNTYSIVQTGSFVDTDGLS